MYANSIILVRKPRRLTSRETAEIVRSVLGAKKAGHAGVLDLNATGVLVVALDEAVKLMPLLMSLDKEYEGVMQVHRHVSTQDLQSAFSRFTGMIVQRPPVRSNVKREPREREVISMEMLEKNKRNVRFRVRCQSGTYIRKLASDIGLSMGMGAHLVSLERTKTGPFLLKDCFTIKDIRRGRFVPVSIEEALERLGIRKVLIQEADISRARGGTPVELSKASVPQGLQEGETVSVFCGDMLVALGRPKGKYLEITRVFNVSL